MNGSLSKRQGEVVRLIALGLPNKAIASELDISISSVDKHRQIAMKKLNRHCTALLTQYAVMNGLVIPR